MEKEILELLVKEIKKMEVQLIIQRTMIEVNKKSTVPGDQAAQHAQGLAFLESQHELNKLTIANLKELIKKEG